MAKQNANLTALGQIQSDTQSAYWSAPYVDAPNTIVSDLSDNSRQLRDPSKTLRPALGVERIAIKSIILSKFEKGPDGEPVWKLNGEDRIRLIGNDWANSSTTDGSHVRSANTVANSTYLEITFFGTGINIVDTTYTTAAYEDYSVTVDGSLGTPVTNGAGQSGVLNARFYAPNRVRPIVKDLALGLHTVRIGFGRVQLFGIEILNQSASINLPSGEVISGGKKQTNSALSSTSFSTNFDGSPVLNGKGGRVVVYRKDGATGKAIQQTDSAPAYTASANHENEEVLRYINFREFGATRTDDFSTLADAVTDRYFTLDDGTTTLVGSAVRVFTSGGTLAAAPGVYVNATGAAGGMIISFVGTGIDFVNNYGNAAETITIYVDGTSVGTIPYLNNVRNKIVPIASGLPYGTHTVRLERGGGSSDFMNTSDFIIYGPKKPSIPEGAVEIGEYYLMADYDGSTITGTALAEQLKRPVGTYQKAISREMLYNGTWSAGGASDVDNPSGVFIFSAVLNNYYEYTFWGTGIVVQHQATTTGTYTFEVQIDGALNASGVARSNVTNAGSGNYTTTTSTLNLPVRVEFTGLTLGLHTIRVTLKTSARNMGGGALHVIAPIHFPNTKRGGLSLNPDVAHFANKDETGGIDLGKAKAWIVFNGSSAAPAIISSKNVAGFLRLTTGQYTVFWQKPFKTNRYAYVYGGAFDAAAITFPGTPGSTNDAGMQAQSLTISTFSASGTQSDTSVGCIACFGELEDEDEE